MASCTSWIFLLASLFVVSSGEGEHYVPWCQVTRNPEKYDQQVVLTAGIAYAGPDASNFVDPGCAPDINRDTDTQWAGDPGARREATWTQLQDLLTKEAAAFVVVRGRFEAYKRYEGPLPSDPKLAEVIRKGNSRFGQQAARFRLVIERVYFLAAVSK